MNQRKQKPPVPLEHDIQAAFIQWVRFAEKSDDRLRLLFAVPNAAKRGRTVAAMMKAEGMVAGIPDVLLPVPAGGFSGLAIEFKRPGGKASDRQVDYMERLVKYGWFVVICTDAEAAIRTVKNYLRNGK